MEFTHGCASVFHCRGTVSPGIAQAVFDMASGSPGHMGIVPAMQTVERPGNEESLVRWRHKRKIEHACENPDTDYTKGEFPEMSFVQTWPFIRLRRVVYNDSIPPDFPSIYHYSDCISPQRLLKNRYSWLSLFSHNSHLCNMLRSLVLRQQWEGVHISPCQVGCVEQSPLIQT